ncbi:hypothetical protein M2140_000118 [Clostridiales Family XIII bacterium PM5-7]
MKYASEYYKGLNTFSNANSNMNRLCKDIEKWSKKQRYTGLDRNFDYKIMIDDSIDIEPELQEEINKLYLEFCKEMADLHHDQTSVRKRGDESLSKYNAMNFTINWGYYYDTYRERSEKICGDKKKLANMAVRACYEFHPQKKNSKFAWCVAGDGIVENLKQRSHPLPLRDDDGEYEYLGKRYTMKQIEGVDEE